MNAKIACCTVWHKITVLPFTCPQCKRTFLEEKPKVEHTFNSAVDKLNELSDEVQLTHDFVQPNHLKRMEILLSELTQIIVVLANRAGENIYGDE